MPDQSPNPNSERTLFGQTDELISTEVGSLNLSDLDGRRTWIATMNALWPWKRWEYRGRLRMASDATSYSVKSIDRWRYPGCFGVPPAAAKRLIALLDAQIAIRQQLRSAWVEYVKSADLARNAALEFKKHKEKRQIFD